MFWRRMAATSSAWRMAPGSSGLEGARAALARKLSRIEERAAPRTRSSPASLAVVVSFCWAYRRSRATGREDIPWKAVRAARSRWRYAARAIVGLVWDVPGVDEVDGVEIKRRPRDDVHGRYESTGELGIVADAGALRSMQVGKKKLWRWDVVAAYPPIKANRY
jgi:hypothetical protein